MAIYDTKLTAKGKIAVPDDIRKQLKLKPGDTVRFIVTGDRIQLIARNVRVTDLAGILGSPPSGVHLTIEEIDDAIGDAVAEDDRRIMDDWNRHQHSGETPDPGRSAAE